MECPKCGLINPESAIRCDCGYDFKSGKVEDSYLYHGADITKEKPLILLHIGLMIVATAILIVIQEYVIRGSPAEYIHPFATMLGLAMPHLLLPIGLVSTFAGIYWLFKRKLMPGIIGIGWFAWVVWAFLSGITLFK